MLRLFFNNRNKRIYFLKSPSFKCQLTLSISVFLLGMIIPVALMAGIIIVVNDLKISINAIFDINAIAGLVFSGILVATLYFITIKSVSLYVDWFVKKYLNYKGEIYNEDGKTLILVKDSTLPFIDSKILNPESYLRSRKENKSYQIEIAINSNDVVNLANYFSNNAISSVKMGTGGGLAAYSIDELLSKLLRLPLKKEYDDTYDD